MSISTSTSSSSSSAVREIIMSEQTWILLNWTEENHSLGDQEKRSNRHDHNERGVLKGFTDCGWCGCCYSPSLHLRIKRWGDNDFLECNQWYEKKKRRERERERVQRTSTGDPSRRKRDKRINELKQMKRYERREKMIISRVEEGWFEDDHNDDDDDDDAADVHREERFRIFFF